MKRRATQVVLLPCVVITTATLVMSCSDGTTKSPVAPADHPPQLGAAVTDAYDGGPIHGAIFTTTPNGGVVNANVQYTDKRQVYLDGGPKGNAPITAAGLPDGLYVFQITEPAGKVLLSDDPAKCRVVRVQGSVVRELVAPSNLPAAYGSLTNYYGTGNPGTACSIADGPEGAAGVSGRHDTNTDIDHGAQGAIVVQMMPFLDTPNPGGVYKAWITPLQTYVAKGGQLNQQTAATKVQGKVVGYARDAGFAAPLSKVKTDNFKVKENPPSVTIDKLVDENRDGLRAGDPAYAVAGGWPMTVSEPVDGGVVVNEHPTPSGNVGVPVSTTVMVCERMLPDWYFSYVYVDGVKVTPLSSPTTDTEGNPVVCVNATSGPGGSVVPVVFGNYQLPELNIIKTPSTQTVVSGDPIDWTITVSNVGLGKAFGVQIRDQLQAVSGGVYSTNTAGCSISSGLLLACNVGQLAGGVSFAAAVRLQTTSGQFCGTVTNTASTYGDGLSTISSSTVSATVTGCGRMTGGSGPVWIDGEKFLTSGFTIHCDIALSNNLEINWPGHKWHITKPITYARCVDDPLVTPGQPDAPFDTFIGEAVGELDGVPNSLVTFTFVDAGEPGKGADRATVRVYPTLSKTGAVLTVVDQPIKGNFQAHEDQPHK